MQNLKIGDVITCKETGQSVRISKVISNPKYDIDGVPCLVHGHFTESGVHVAISFGRTLGSNQRVEDWRKWTL